jgi:hypothetical protein
MILATLALIVAFIFAVNGYMVLDFAGRFELAVTFISIGASSLFWLCSSIRCPRCGKRPVWGILKTFDVSTWLVKLHAMERCPECGPST